MMQFELKDRLHLVRGDFVGRMRGVCGSDQSNCWYFCYVLLVENSQYIFGLFSVLLIIRAMYILRKFQHKIIYLSKMALRSTNILHTETHTRITHEQMPFLPMQLPAYNQYHNIPGTMKFFKQNQTLQRSLQEDSQEESLFHVEASPAKSKAIRKMSLGKRLVGRSNDWDRSQSVLYLDFLKEHFGFLQGAVRGQRTALYDLMSQYIKTKNYAQCRIYHSRQLAKWGSLEKIINALEKDIRGISSIKMSYRHGLQVCLQEESCPVQQETQDLWSVLEQDHHEKDSLPTGRQL